MSVSLFKMTEAGNTSFNINRIPDLIRVFKDADLIFDRLAKFIVGQNIIDNLMSNHNKSAENAMLELANIDGEFKCLSERIGQYFDFEEGTRPFKDYVQQVGVNEVKLFLQNPKYPMDAVEVFDSKIAEMIKHAPSLSINVLLDFMRSFSNIIPLHFDKIAADWEEHNYHSIITVDGLYLDPQLILKKENLSRFNYKYLTNDKFTSLRFIFKTDENINELKAKFFSDLNTYRKEKNEEKIDKRCLERIHFMALPVTKIDVVSSLLHDPLNPKNQFQGFWVFGTNSLKIGFIGVTENDVNIGYNLSYSESIKRSKIFDSLFV